MGVSNAGGVGRNRDSEPISSFTAVNAATGQVLSIRRRRPRHVSCGTSLVVTGGVC